MNILKEQLFSDWMRIGRVRISRAVRTDGQDRFGGLFREGAAAAMKIERFEDHGVITLPQEVNLINISEFKQAVQALSEQDCKQIYLDCSQLKMIDSAGLGSFVLCQKQLKKHGGELKIANVHHEYVKHLFDMIDLKRVINIEE